LAVTVGDGEKTFQRLLPVFKAFGRNMIYVGPVGYGQAARLVNQMAALNTAAVVEGLHLAKALGLDVEKETQVSSLGAARSGSIELYLPKLSGASSRQASRRPTSRRTWPMPWGRIGEVYFCPPPRSPWSCTRFVEKGLGELGIHALGEVY
jgi:3-hydroxyisobutyrate dehydrogenase